MATKVQKQTREVKREARGMAREKLEKFAEQEKAKFQAAKTIPEMTTHQEAYLEAIRAIGKLEAAEKASKRASASKSKKKGTGTLAGTVKGTLKALGLG